MSDDLVKRFQMVGQYDEWQMEQVDGCGGDCSSETEWVKADDHTAVIIAKDAEIARLRSVIGVAAHQLSLQSQVWADDARAALNTHHKGETP